MLEKLFERLQERSPILMMVWALLENTLTPEFLDGLFERSKVKQYTRRLFFSDIVALMSTVVTGVHTSVHEAFKRSVLEKSISFVAMYGKINRIEPTTCALLVHEVAQRLHGLIEQLGAKLPALIPGYPTRILDGNALGGTDHRLKVLRGTRSAPLPGKSLVVLDAELQLATHMIPCEDGWAQERSLFDHVLKIVKAGELWIADRNFCTAGFLHMLTERGAKFLIRQHAGLRWNSLEPLVFPEGVKIAEHRVSIPWENGEIIARRIVVRLETPTRDGDLELFLLTTIPPEHADAALIAQTYHERWGIENLFHVLTTTLRCEIKSQGYPKAALFAFAVALVAANIMATVRAGIRAVHGREQEASLSNFYLVRDVQRKYDSLEEGFTPEALAKRARMNPEVLVAFLLTCAQHVRLEAYRKAQARPGQRTKRPRGTPDDPPHVSTARLLATAQRRSP